MITSFQCADPLTLQATLRESRGAGRHHSSSCYQHFLQPRPSLVVQIARSGLVTETRDPGGQWCQPVNIYFFFSVNPRGIASDAESTSVVSLTISIEVVKMMARWGFAPSFCCDRCACSVIFFKPPIMPPSPF